jgi:DNA-binding NtrC family response regulator
VVTIRLPPLRERLQDIPRLTDYFLDRFAREMDIDNPGMTEEAKRMLKGYHWPGNVRELANAIQKALIFSRGYPLRPEDISQVIAGESLAKDEEPQNHGAIRQWARKALLSESGEEKFDTLIDQLASLLISEALDITNGNRSRAAKLLGLSRPTLQSKIEKYRIKMETSVKSEGN